MTGGSRWAQRPDRPRLLRPRAHVAENGRTAQHRAPGPAGPGLTTEETAGCLRVLHAARNGPRTRLRSITLSGNRPPGTIRSGLASPAGAACPVALTGRGRGHGGRDGSGDRPGPARLFVPLVLPRLRIVLPQRSEHSSHAQQEQADDEDTARAPQGSAQALGTTAATAAAAAPAAAPASRGRPSRIASDRPAGPPCAAGPDTTEAAGPPPRPARRGQARPPVHAWPPRSGPAPGRPARPAAA